jgi:hypothetical protein
LKFLIICHVFRVMRSLVIGQSYYCIPLFMSQFQIPVSFCHLLIRIHSVNYRSYFPRLSKLCEDNQIFFYLLCMSGSNNRNKFSLRFKLLILQSLEFTAVANTLILTSFLLDWGFNTSPSTRTSGGPYFVHKIAFIFSM